MVKILRNKDRETERERERGRGKKSEKEKEDENLPSYFFEEKERRGVTQCRGGLLTKIKKS